MQTHLIPTNSFGQNYSRRHWRWHAAHCLQAENNKKNVTFLTGGKHWATHNLKLPKSWEESLITCAVQSVPNQLQPCTRKGTPAGSISVPSLTSHHKHLTSVTSLPHLQYCSSHSQKVSIHLSQTSRHLTAIKSSTAFSYTSEIQDTLLLPSFFGIVSAAKLLMCTVNGVAK